MGKCKFSEKWLVDERYKDWLKQTKDPSEVRCELCRKTFKLGTMGMKSLDSHMRSEKHQRYVSTRKSTIPIQSYCEDSSRPTTTSSTSVVCVTDVQPTATAPVAKTSSSAFSGFSPTPTLKAEVIWSLQTASKHHSYTSNDGIHEVFRAMFPDSEMAKTFTCGRDKTAYLVRFGFAPYMKKQLISRINEDTFVIMFDESMNQTTKNKQLDLHVRHWTTDETGTHVESRFFGSEFMGHSTADDMVEHFKVTTTLMCFVVQRCRTLKMTDL